MDKMATSGNAGITQESVHNDDLEKEVQVLQDASDFAERKISKLEEELHNLQLEEQTLSNEEKRLQKEIEYFITKNDEQTKILNNLSFNVKKYEVDKTCIESFIKTPEDKNQEDELTKLDKMLAQEEEQKRIQKEQLKKLNGLMDSNNKNIKQLFEQLKNADLYLLFSEKN